MKQWMQQVQATVEVVSEMVDREWRTLEEWVSYSAVQRPLFAQVVQGLEAYAGVPLFSQWGAHREQQRLLARQMRDELFLLLSEMEPAEAMAVLSSLPAAQVLGYQQDRLATLLSVEAAHVQAWEEAGFASMQELVSERTPLLQFIAQRVGEIGSEQGTSAGSLGSAFANEHGGAYGASFEMRTSGQAAGGQDVVTAKKGDGVARGMAFEMRTSGSALAESARSLPAVMRSMSEGELPLLLQEARVRPHFDLRQFVTPALELSIRQKLHQHGIEDVEQVQSHFAKEDHAAVQLVAERMKVEMSGGKEERADG